MKFSKTSPAERAALVWMVSASAKLIVVIGRSIKNGPNLLGEFDRVDGVATEFVDAIIGAQESE